MREVLLPMPRIEREFCRCAVCGDELTPGLKVYMRGRYDPKAHRFDAEYAHIQCGTRKDHIIPDGEVLKFWKRLAVVLSAKAESTPNPA